MLEGHADASPSAASQWLNCPASVTQARGRERKATPYTREGTAAHEVAELMIHGLQIPSSIEVEGETIEITDEMIERIDEKLGHPERCPHGWPVDTAVEQRENLELAPLAALVPGTRATIVRLAEHDGDLLPWFYDQGLVPGQQIEMRSAEPAADQFTIGLIDGASAGDDRAISEKAAAGLFVKPA